jgi:hypothetical protein
MSYYDSTGHKDFAHATSGAPALKAQHGHQHLIIPAADGQYGFRPGRAGMGQNGVVPDPAGENVATARWRQEMVAPERQPGSPRRQQPRGRVSP